MIIPVFISALVQLVVFMLIPFVTYLINHKTTKGFFRWVGLYRTTQRATIYAVSAAVLLGILAITSVFTIPAFKAASTGPGTVPELLIALHSDTDKLVILLITALLKTSLAEEILFRGYLGKILIRRLGFKKGNLSQALLFGLVHVLLFLNMPHTGISFLTFSFIVPCLGGYAAGYLNEIKGNGSIIPGWIMHGLANCFSYGFLTFLS